MKYFVFSLILWGITPFFTSYIQAAKIVWLDDLPDRTGASPSAPWGISDDHSVAIGASGYFSRIEAVRWTVDGNVIGMGDLLGEPFESFAGDVSSDGRVIVGRGTIGAGDDGSEIWEAFRWTAETGMIGLGHLSGGNSHATAISGDGTVIVGHSEEEAFRWTAETGMVGLGAGFASDISSDGKVIVGRTITDELRNAFRWTAETGMVELGDVPEGQSHSVATSVSADGSIIVGYISNELERQPFRWTAETGIVALGILPSGGDYPTRGSAHSVTGDGTIIVGSSHVDGVETAFIWDVQSGMRNLRDVFVNDYGLDLSKWTGVSRANDISADGTVIVGLALGGGAWMVVVPEPSSGVLAMLGLFGAVAWIKVRKSMQTGLGARGGS